MDAWYTEHDARMAARKARRRLPGKWQINTLPSAVDKKRWCYSLTQGRYKIFASGPRHCGIYFHRKPYELHAYAAKPRVAYAMLKRKLLAQIQEARQAYRHAAKVWQSFKEI